MRRTISFILLCTILMNSIGYIALYGMFRWHITHEISELIEHHDSQEFAELILPLSIIQNPGKDFTRTGRREFRYQGKMYDIVSQKLSGNFMHFTVIHDPNDERNFQKLSKNTAMHSQSPQNTENGKSVLIDIIVKGLFSSLFSQTLASHLSILSRGSLFSIQHGILPDSPTLQVLVPPPQCS